MAIISFIDQIKININTHAATRRKNKFGGGVVAMRESLNLFTSVSNPKEDRYIYFRISVFYAYCYVQYLPVFGGYIIIIEGRSDETYSDISIYTIAYTRVHTHASHATHLTCVCVSHHISLTIEGLPNAVSHRHIYK